MPFNIVLVDDHKLVRDGVKTILERGSEFHVIGEAENGDDAVKAYTAQRPELVLLDLIMPGKNGLAVLAEIKALDPAAKVVMVTAVEQDILSEQLIGKGAIGVLHKPFLYAELEAILKQQ